MGYTQRVKLLAALRKVVTNKSEQSEQFKSKLTEDLLSFYELADAEKNIKKWQEDATKEANKLNKNQLLKIANYYFDEHGSWNGEDAEDWRQNFETLKAKEQKENLIHIYIADYIDQRIRTTEDTSEVYFEKPRIVKNVTLYRFSPVKPEEILKHGFSGHSPENMGVTVHFSGAEGDLAFAYEKKDMTPQKIKSAKKQYGNNVYEFTVPFAIKVYHNGDGEDQIVFDVNTVKNLRNI